MLLGKIIVAKSLFILHKFLSYSGVYQLDYYDAAC